MERVSKKIGENDLIIETGRMAKQADGAVAIQIGGTVVLVTSVCSKTARERRDFLPLTCEYREKPSAAGKIPGGFFKREGKPSEKEVLSARLIDRPIRPLFPSGMINDIQIVSMVLSSDCENDSDILAVNGASAALSISDIPFDGPIGCVRVGLIEGKFVVNPTFEQVEKSELDLIAVGKGEKITMVEAGAKEVSEEKIEEAIKCAQQYIKEIIELQKELVKKVGRKKRENIITRKTTPELVKKVKGLSTSKLSEISKMPLKEQKEEALAALKAEITEKLVDGEEGSPEAWEINLAMNELEESEVREAILGGKKRGDGRTADEIRPIECNIGVLPRTHGSGLFTRGQTQSLCVTTLGTGADEQTIDALEGESSKAFMLHYNFPGFSVGEVSPFRGPGRREIGHGALAERALKEVMPSNDDFPYTVRLVADILESNGSSSMASVCAGSLALMDAGVPIKAPVSGIAIGLVTDGKKSVVLTDIAGAEDHYGDMDFKVAGTATGITAVQLDLKIKGIEMGLLKEALGKAKKARLEILEKMKKVIAEPKKELSGYAPRIVNIKVKLDKIKDVIGPGGRTIKKIIRETGVTIDIDDDGNVQIASSDEAQMKAAIDIVSGLTTEPEIGKVYEGTITRLMNFGAFCEILPGKEGLVHVSEIADRFVKDVASELEVGQEVRVKVMEIDDQGRVNLSIKRAKENEGEENKNPGQEEGKR